MLIDIVNEQAKYEEVHLIIINKFNVKDFIGFITDRVTIHCIERKPGSRNPLPLLHLNLLVLKLSPDILHCHNHDLINILFVNRKRAVYTIHDVNIDSRNFNKYLKLFAISKTVQQDIKARYNLKPGLVYNGIYINKVIAKVYSSSCSSIYRILQVSRLDHQKKRTTSGVRVPP